MVYVILTLILVAAVILVLRYQSIAKQRELERKIHEAWGRQKKETPNFNLIGKYAAEMGSSKFHRLSGQTVTDMDFYDLFGFIDRTTSRVGQQYLFNKVIHPGNDPKALQQLSDTADFFTDNSSLRVEIQRELSRLHHFHAYYIPHLLRANLLERPPWLKYVNVSIAITVLILALSIVYPVFLIVLILPVAVNMLIHYWNKENIYQFILSFPQLNILIDVCSKVSGKHVRFADHTLATCISNLRPFQQKMGLISTSDQGGIKTELSQVAMYFIELLKAIFLIEVVTLFDLIAQLETKRESILLLFAYIGEIDVSLSVASLRAGQLKTCRPTILPAGKRLSARNVYHPLISNCVKNDIVIHSRSVLITGSNMSGKSTFLRTMILNSILAQTLYTCFADEFETPILKQFSSIRIDDSVLEGTSYYFEEVNTMATLVNEVASPNQNLFILDEVFRGTNMVERIASAKAILSYLNQKNNIVMVSTHDIELSKLLEDEYELYHFVEALEDRTFSFDHKLKPGPLRTRNAIRILEMSNYPEAIIDEAKQISKVLDSRQGNNQVQSEVKA